MNSTTLGSISIMRTSLGERRYARLRMMQLMHTDLPEPVVPATSIWGMSARSAVITLPVMSLPRANTSEPLAFLKLSLSNTSRSSTGVGLSLGISMPMVVRPGMGASMRTGDEASATPISFFSTVTLPTLMPGASCISKRMMRGPSHMLTIVALTPKLARVSMSALALASTRLLPARTPTVGFLSRVSGGRRYSYSSDGSPSTIGVVC